MNHIPIKFAALAIAALLLSACATSPPTTFYTLSAMAPVTSTSQAPGKHLIVGVGPISVSPYLERNQIVIRTSQTSLDLNDLNSWAEPIETSISRVIAANLGMLLPGIQPIVRPWADADVEHHVVAKVSRFESDAEGNITLEADWGIKLNSSGRMPLIRHDLIRQPGTGTDYESITRNMSLALAKLSEKIALELKKSLKLK